MRDQLGGLQRVVAASGGLFEWRSRERFARAVLQDLVSLPAEEAGAVKSPVSALVARREDKLKDLAEEVKAQFGVDSLIIADPAAGLAWKGSMVYDATTRVATIDGSWTGPFPMLYDDGPWNQGGHEPAGATAGGARSDGRAYA